MATEEHERKTKLPEALRERFSAIVSIISFWAMAIYWNVAFGELDFVPILGFGAALSWVVFLHAEVIGVIIMSMMRRRLQAEARAEGRAQAWVEMMTQTRAEARDELEKARTEARDEAEKARAEARDEAEKARAEARDEAEKARAEAVNNMLEEARARARAEARAEAMAESQAEAVAEAREARQIIRDLERQLREARNGESANGA